MKTRKVGKIVSLLVAIVLVATIMIPAAGVLANSSEYAGVTWTEVGDFASLKQAFDNANKTGEKTYIRLTSDITLQRPYFNNDKINVEQTQFVQHNWGKMYLYSTTRITKIEEKLRGDWVSGKKTTHDFAWLMSQANSPFNISDPNAYFYGYTEDELKNGFLVDKGMQDYVGMGKKAGQGTGYDEKIGYEYSERMLVVDENADITVDLYGKTMKASDYDPYDSTPDYQMSAIKVNKGGALTVVDLSSEQTGTISGGTGNVYYEETVSTDNSEHTRDAMFDEDWTVIDTTGWWGWLSSDGKYNIEYQSKSTWVENVKESRGGGIYVENGGVFTLKNGKITGNGAYMDAGKTVFASDVDSVTKGGGVFVEAGGKFYMHGGEISNNASRAYQTSTKGSAKDAYAYGGGVYLEGTQGNTAGAVMYMSGGKIAENATYSQVASTGSSAKSARAYGGGVYVGEGAVCSIIGNDVEVESTDLDMVKSFPQVTNNSCGAVTQYSTAKNPDITLQGGGIYNGGTLNLKNALITANDFAEGNIDIPGLEKLPDQDAISLAISLANRSKTMISKATRVVRDPETGLARYIESYNADGTPNYVTRLDEGFSENLELATEQVDHAATGVYGTMIGNEDMGLFSDGAGVCVRENAKLVVGERVWITDNYDLVTTAHKAFTSIRDYKRTWQQEKNITDDRVVSTDPETGKGEDYTDPAGGYVYDEKATAPETAVDNNGVTYTTHAMDGYAFSDTTDDVYLPEEQVIYKGGSLYETKIGVNYWNMVNADGTVVNGGFGQAGNRVIVKAGKNLTSVDPNGKLIWDEETTTPTQRDIQFFYLNDNNKNWERFKNVTRNANNDYYDYDKNGDGSPVYGYALPAYIKIDPNSAIPKTLCDTKAAASSNWDDRVRVTAIDTNNSAVNKDASPYEGYINYNIIYSANRWSYGTEVGGIKSTYDKETYRISDPDWTPDNKDFRPEGGDLSNAIVNFPQRAYPVTADMKNSLPSSYLKAKYMDYKVVYDDNQFDTSTEPVIRFGTYSDPASNDTIRKMFVTVNFDEADKHYYGVSNNSSIVYNSGSEATSAQTYTFTTKNTAFANVDASALFYGANRVKGTIDIAKIVPNYESYGKGDILKDLRAAAYADAESSLSYDDADKKNESIDLYFKGWKYYTSYGDGPKVETLSNSVEESRIEGTSLSYRGYFPVNLENIFNPNINSQPCPSLTAIWYTKEELAAARQNLSACKAQLILGTDGHIYIRVISVLGAYGKDRNNLQPIQASDANSSLSSLYYNAPTFVASKLNATPTLEGGYKATVNKGNIAAGENFSARVVKKIICNDDEKNTFTIDIYDYISGKKNNEKDVWVKFINSNPEYKKANNSKSTTYVSFMWTNIDTGLTLDKISNADGSDYSDVAKEVWFVTPCIELTKDQAGYKHDSYYYGASRGFSIASLDTQDHNKLLEQAKTATN